MLSYTKCSEYGKYVLFYWMLVKQQPDLCIELRLNSALAKGINLAQCLFRGRGQDGKGNGNKIHWRTVEQMGISEIRLEDRHNLCVTCLQMLWKLSEKSWVYIRRQNLGPVDMFQVTSKTILAIRTGLMWKDYLINVSASAIYMYSKP